MFFFFKGAGQSLPADDTNDLTIWLDGKDATTITLNGGNVSAWNNKGSSGGSFTQATAANQPARVTDGVDFDGTNDTLTRATATSVPSTGFWLFAVQEPDTITSGDNDIFQADNIDLIIGYNDGNRLRARTPAGDNLNALINTANYLNLKRILAFKVKSGDNASYADGGAAVETSATTFSTTTEANVHIGSRGGSSAFFDGTIYELRKYNTDLSVARVNVIGTHLAAKHAATWSAIS